jgi:hypothetical protein
MKPPGLDTPLRGYSTSMQATAAGIVCVTAAPDMLIE